MLYSFREHFLRGWPWHVSDLTFFSNLFLESITIMHKECVITIFYSDDICSYWNRQIVIYFYNVYLKKCGLFIWCFTFCSFPAATNETFLQKINTVHKDNMYYEVPYKKEHAFIIKHYAGKVKYQVRY